MTKQRLQVAVLAVLLLSLTACKLGVGATPGSSSESVPPLQPAASTTSSVGFAFATSGYTLHAWPPEEELQTASALDPHEVRDTTGALVVNINGHQYNHPVGEAQDGMKALAVYLGTHDQTAWRIAMADANRLVETHTEAMGAWWFPYPFDHVLYSGAMAHAPWYSAMAQGEACDLFTRLYLQTHDARWRTAADNAFASFLHPYSGNNEVPWVDNVASGYLWFQEYPTPQPDYTINGAFFAIAGVVKYAITFGDPRAKLVADGAITTMLHDVPQARNPGWISSYSLSQKAHQSEGYHNVVTRQLALMYTITHDARFATLAEQFDADFPILKVEGAITLPPATYTITRAYKYESVDQKQIVIDSPMRVIVAERAKIGHTVGYWYLITSGPYTGHWIQESATIHLTTPVDVLALSPSIQARLTGAYHLYTYQQGKLQPMGTMNASPSQPMTLDEHATIDATDVWHITLGPHAGEYISGAAPTFIA